MLNLSWMVSGSSTAFFVLGAMSMLFSGLLLIYCMAKDYRNLGGGLIVIIMIASSLQMLFLGGGEFNSNQREVERKQQHYQVITKNYPMIYCWDSKKGEIIVIDENN